jgi:ABC-type sugar transport system ATPase subunit
MSFLELRGVEKNFGAQRAIKGIDLAVEKGEFVVFVGPSGCGKSTLLRMIAGLTEIDAGTLRLDGRDITKLASSKRDLAMVFQSYALYPHMTVRRNIEFPLRQRRVTGPERDQRALEVASLLGLEDLLDRKPGQLSGGQRQRVALARAIVRDPQVFLMDEPLSNLDATLRVHTRADIVSMQRRLGTTTLYVTHDQVEAMTMGHRIAVMRDGQLQQVAAPQDLYEHPANTFVASFLGSPGMNLVPGAIDGDTAIVAAAKIELPVRLSTLRDGAVTFGFRPEAASLASTGIPARVDLVELLGAETHTICSLDDGTKVVVRQGYQEARADQGEHVTIAVDATELHVFDAESGRRLEPSR